MRILRKILLPVAVLYGIIMLIRNFLYHIKVLRSRSYRLPVICVGNLSVGGTGKTPMIEYLLLLLLPNYRTATLSRGYGRKTSGYYLVQNDDHAEKVGDEPLQFKSKFENAIVAVDEKRTRGIDALLKTESPEVILLDDAFQHRKVKAGLNILLTTYGQLYTDDFILPSGNLREPILGAQRAKVVVVTKCPKKLSKKEQSRIEKKLGLRDYQKLFFSYIDYSDRIYGRDNYLRIEDIVDKEVSLVTGIAKPLPLREYLESIQINYTHLDFPDHHAFTEGELSKIRKAPFVLTTEKDYMRLRGIIDHENLYYIPIKMKFLNDASAEFDKIIEDYIINEK